MRPQKANTEAESGFDDALTSDERAHSSKVYSGDTSGSACGFGLSRLLLVVDCGTCDLLARRIFGRHGQRASLTIRRHHNSSAGGDLSILFVSQCQGLLVDFLV
jgi:hypothetical protein